MRLFLYLLFFFLQESYCCIWAHKEVGGGGKKTKKKRKSVLQKIYNNAQTNITELLRQTLEKINKTH